jgi:predicted HAD superfamily Cof-like phosphohydrolase
MVAVGNPASSKVAADKVKPRNVINRRKTNQRHRALAAASKEPPRGTETAGNKHRANLRSKEGTKLRKQVSREMQRPEMGIVGTRQRMAASVIAARVR